MMVIHQLASLHQLETQELCCCSHCLCCLLFAVAQIRELTSQNSRINANNLFLMSDVGTVDVKMSINSKDPADRVVGVAFIPAYTLPAGTNAVKKDQGFFNKCCSENV